MEEVLKQFSEQEKLKDSFMPMYMNIIHAIGKVKSIRRAFKRNRISQYGLLVSHRPFNNRKNTSKRKGADSRFITTLKKRDYEYAKRKSMEQLV